MTLGEIGFLLSFYGALAALAAYLVYRLGRWAYQLVQRAIAFYHEHEELKASHRFMCGYLAHLERQIRQAAPADAPVQIVNGFPVAVTPHGVLYPTRSRLIPDASKPAFNPTRTLPRSMRPQ